MGLRHHQSPAVRADALDISGDVAGFVLAVLQRARFIAEHQCAEQHLTLTLDQIARLDAASAEVERASV